MGALKIDTRALKELSEKMGDPLIESYIEQILMEKGFIALVAQAIGDNFRQEGPGWAPLKASTIRGSVSQKLKKKLRALSDDDLLKWELLARKEFQRTLPAKDKAKKHRKILDQSGTLRSSVTVPNYVGKGGGNIFYREGSKVFWGSNLPYAAAQNHGSPSQGIPQREYLVLRQAWEDRIYAYALGRIFELIKKQFEAA